MLSLHLIKLSNVPISSEVLVMINRMLSTPRLIGDVFPSLGFRPLDKIMTYFVGGFLGHYLGFGAMKHAPKEQ